MRFEPISKVAYNSIQKWLRMERAKLKDASKPSPNVDLLRRGLPQGCIKNITEDMSIALIDTRDDTFEALRSPRYFDPAGIALVRLLLFGEAQLDLTLKTLGWKCKWIILSSVDTTRRLMVAPKDTSTKEVSLALAIRISTSTRCHCDA